MQARVHTFLVAGSGVDVVAFVIRLTNSSESSCGGSKFLGTVPTGNVLVWTSMQCK